MRLPIIFFTLLSSLFASTSHAWSVLENWGAGPSHTGRAQIPTAVDATLDDTYAQPGQLGHLKNLQLNFGFLLEAPLMEFQSLQGDDKSDQWLAPESDGGLVLSVSVPLGGILKKRLVFGTHVYLPARRLLAITGFEPSEAFLYRYAYGHRVHNATIFGAEITSWFSLGAGFRFSTRATTDMTLNVDPFDSELDYQRISIDVTPVLAPVVGAHFGAFDIGIGKLGFSTAFHEKMVDSIDVISRNNLNGILASVNVLLDVLSNFGPRRASGVLSFKTNSNFLLTSSFEWEEWSDVVDPSAIVAMDLGGDDLEQLGLQDGLDIPGEGKSRNGDLGFVDTFNWGFGFETPLWNDGWAFKGGWKYRPTPVPDQIGLTNMIDNNTHIGALGITWHLQDPMSWSEAPMDINFAWQGHFFETRKTEKKYADDPVGNWQSKGSIHCVRLDLTYKF